MILRYIARNQLAHRRAGHHPSVVAVEAVILHQDPVWQHACCSQSKKSSLHRGKRGGGVPSELGSLLVHNHRSTGMNLPGAINLITPSNECTPKLPLPRASISFSRAIGRYDDGSRISGSRLIIEPRP